MNKRELVKRVVGKTGEKAENVAQVIDCMVDVIREGLSKGEKVKLKNLGVLMVVKWKPRRFWNPITKQLMEPRQCTVIRFRPSVSLAKKIKALQ